MSDGEKKAGCKTSWLVVSYMAYVILDYIPKLRLKR